MGGTLCITAEYHDIEMNVSADTPMDSKMLAGNPPHGRYEGKTEVRGQKDAGQVEGDEEGEEGQEGETRSVIIHFRLTTL